MTLPILIEVAVRKHLLVFLLFVLCLLVYRVCAINIDWLSALWIVQHGLDRLGLHVSIDHVVVLDELGSLAPPLDTLGDYRLCLVADLLLFIFHFLDRLVDVLVVVQLLVLGRLADRAH